jgi:hypothetical protein
MALEIFGNRGRTQWWRAELPRRRGQVALVRARLPINAIETAHSEMFITLIFELPFPNGAKAAKHYPS